MTDLRSYVLNGYTGKEEPHQRMLGFLLWWRTWAATLVIAVGPAIAVYYGSDSGSAITGWVVGAATATIANELWDEES